MNRYLVLNGKTVGGYTSNGSPWFPASEASYKEFLIWAESNVFIDTETQLLVAITSMDPFQNAMSMPASWIKGALPWGAR
jgi:hypothetical protein